MRLMNTALLATFLVAGCAAGGNEKVRTETMETVATKVTKGVTTKDQVRALYGEPISVSLTDGGGEVWNYEYAHAQVKGATFIPVVGIFAGGQDIAKNQVVFIFKNNIVENYTVHQSKTEVNNFGKDVNSSK